MANELFAYTRRPRSQAARVNHLALASPIVLLFLATLLALPVWPWSYDLGYRPCGAIGIVDLALLAGLVGRG